MQYNTRVNRIKSEPEINNGPVLVESAGFMTRTQKIRMFIDAGAHLIKAREDMYDYYEGQDDIENMVVDPTRRRNFDMAEASQMMHELNARIRAQNAAITEEQKAAQEAAKVSESAVTASQTAPEAPKGA